MREAACEIEATDEQAATILRECLRAFDAIQLRLTGDCMAPALLPGDLVTVAAASTRRPRIGDVLLFRGAHGLRLHRLVPGLPRRGALLRAKADRAPHWDPPIDPTDVIGTVIAVERGGLRFGARSVQTALRSALGGVLARLRL
jgi:hypothetical protein